MIYSVLIAAPGIACTAASSHNQAALGFEKLKISYRLWKCPETKGLIMETSEKALQFPFMSNDEGLLLLTETLKNTRNFAHPDSFPELPGCWMQCPLEYRKPARVQSCLWEEKLHWNMSWEEAWGRVTWVILGIARSSTAHCAQADQPKLASVSVTLSSTHKSRYIKYMLPSWMSLGFHMAGSQPQYPQHV